MEFPKSLVSSLDLGFVAQRQSRKSMLVTTFLKVISKENERWKIKKKGGQFLFIDQSDGDIKAILNETLAIQKDLFPLLSATASEGSLSLNSMFFKVKKRLNFLKFLCWQTRGVLVLLLLSLSLIPSNHSRFAWLLLMQMKFLFFSCSRFTNKV